MIRLIGALVTLLSLTIPGVAHACLDGSFERYIFFSARPANLPAWVVVAKVLVPTGDALDRHTVDLELLEETAGLRGEKRVRVELDGLVSSCDRLGVIGAPAYVAGLLKHMPGGGVVLVPLRMHAAQAARRPHTDFDRYIVDPAYRIEETEHGE